MDNSSAISPGKWYREPDVLTAELRRGRFVLGPSFAPVGYDDVAEIARGAQGVVYAAVQRATRQRVAIKVMHERIGGDPRAAARFEREIELAAGLRHPHIVRVYDGGVTADGRRYGVMEFIEGVPLSQYLESTVEASADSAVRLRLIIRIVRAVAAAHQRGVIHRDLKPGNILVDARGEPHVVDFGLARPIEADAALTLSGAFVGTLAYASPEQLGENAAEIDARTDIYSLGAILYEMLTGRLPHATDRPMAQVIRSICENDPPTPSRFGRIDRDLEAIVLTALARDRERRYATAVQFADDIERYLAGEPVMARGRSAAYVLLKLLRRHAWATAAAAAFVVLLAGFGAAMAALYQQARAEADRARQINYFLQDTLASVEPRDGREVTVRGLLDESDWWIGSTLGGQPAVEAAVRNTIGNSYRALGALDSAEQQFDRALAIRRGLFGERSSETAESINSLAWLRRRQGRLDEAERLYREGLEIRREIGGVESLDVAMSRANLAGVLVEQKRFDEAEPLLRECLAIRERTLGPDHADTLMARFQVAELMAARGDPAGAEALHRTVLQARRRVLPEGHPDVARSMLALGDVLTRLGRPDEAAALSDAGKKMLDARKAGG